MDKFKFIDELLKRTHLNEAELQKTILEGLESQGVLSQKAKSELFTQEQKAQKPTSESTDAALSANTNPERTQAIEDWILPKNIPLSSVFSSTERYKVLDHLGEGGMGIVQKVQDMFLGREVALKKIKLENHSFSDLPYKQRIRLWRLQREAFIMAILEHPNIVPLYDMQQNADGEFCFTMRKIEGQTFSEILKEKTSKKSFSRFEEDSKILTTFLKVCDAMSYAHAQGVVHRDLKPDNIMVGEFGEVYVMDWGIAKKLKGETATKPLSASVVDSFQNLSTDELESSLFSEEETIVEPNDQLSKNEANYQTIGGIGTQGYMPPEQRQNAANANPQSDIFALGKILRQCYTLLTPIEEFNSILNTLKTDAEKENQISSKNNILNKKIPTEIFAIVNKATAEKPEDRYQKIQDFSNDLTNYLQHRRISAKEYSLFELFRKWTRRNLKNLIVALIAILFVQFVTYEIRSIHRKRNLRILSKRFNYWAKQIQLEEHLAEGIKEFAIFEFAKMRDPKFVKRLIQHFQEGTQYYLKEKTKRDPKKERFYLFVVKVLGLVENPTPKPVLASSLKLLVDKYSKIPVEERMVSDIRFLIEIAKTFFFRKRKHDYHIFNKLRNQMGPDGIFWERTIILDRELKNWPGRK